MGLLPAARMQLHSYLRKHSAAKLASLSLWSSLALAVGILFACLWPFHQPANGVAWLGWRNGVRIKGHGAMMGVAPRAFAIPGEFANVSFETWVAPDADKTSSMILTYWNPEEHGGFSLFQAHGRLLLQVQHPGPARARRQVSSVRSSPFFELGKEVLISVTFGESGTAVYTDGVLLDRFPNFRLPARALTGRLVVGSEPQAGDSWYGKFLGFAAYQRELSAEDVRRHASEWEQHGRPTLSHSDQCTALYAFDEGTGGTAHNAVDPAADLVIPARYDVLDKERLPPVWRELTSEPWYWRDIAENIAGFLPLGLTLCAYFGFRGRASVILPTAVACFLLSLSVELLQGFLPTRDSSTTDVLSNTFGGWLGASFWRKALASRKP